MRGNQVGLVVVVDCLGNVGVGLRVDSRVADVLAQRVEHMDADAVAVFLLIAVEGSLDLGIGVGQLVGDGVENLEEGLRMVKLRIDGKVGTGGGGDLLEHLAVKGLGSGDGVAVPGDAVKLIVGVERPGDQPERAHHDAELVAGHRLGDGIAVEGGERGIDVAVRIEVGVHLDGVLHLRLNGAVFETAVAVVDPDLRISAVGVGHRGDVAHVAGNHDVLVEREGVGRESFIHKALADLNDFLHRGGLFDVELFHPVGADHDHAPVVVVGAGDGNAVGDAVIGAVLQRLRVGLQDEFLILGADVLLEHPGDVFQPPGAGQLVKLGIVGGMDDVGHFVTGDGEVHPGAVVIGGTDRPHVLQLDIVII